MRKVKEKLERLEIIGDRNTVIKVIYDRIIVRQVAVVDGIKKPFERSVSIPMSDCEIDDSGRFIYRDIVRPIDQLIPTIYTPRTLDEFLEEYINPYEKFDVRDSDGSPRFYDAEEGKMYYLSFKSVIDVLVDHCTEDVIDNG